MADPARNMGALRSISVPPPAKAPAGKRRAKKRPDPQPAAGAPAAVPEAPAEATAAAPVAATAVGERARPAPARAASQAAGQPDEHRRDKATTYYLGSDTFDRLLVAQERLGKSRPDLMLEAIRTSYNEVAAEHRRDATAPDPILALPPRPTRQQRGRVKDGRSVQFVLSVAEHAAIRRVAEEAGLSASELVGRCIDTTWPN